MLLLPRAPEVCALSGIINSKGSTCGRDFQPVAAMQSVDWFMVLPPA